MLKLGSVLMVIAACAAASIGCGDGQSDFSAHQAKFDAAKDAVRQRCVDDNKGRDLGYNVRDKRQMIVTEKEAAEGCELGFEIAKRVAANAFVQPGISKPVMDVDGGGIKMIEVKLAPLDRYLGSQMRPDGFFGSNWACLFDDQVKANPVLRDACTDGARALFVEVAKTECGGVDLMSIKDGDNVTCLFPAPKPKYVPHMVYRR